MSTPPPPAVCRLDHASVRFGDVLALDDVSLEVVRGEVLAVAGGDGAGKSTLLRALVGRRALTSGAVQAPPREEIGYLSAAANGWPELSVAENMAFAAEVFGMRGGEAREVIAGLLASAGLLEAKDRLASKLSGGMKRKLGFSMALVHAPRMLVVDEPSTGVDPVSRVELWRLLAEAAARGTAVVMSTTYLDEAERASRLIVLDSGRVIVSGRPSEAAAAVPGIITESTSSVRAEWAWRRGRLVHEYWPEGTSHGATRIAPDLEDVVIALSLSRRNAAVA